MTPETITGYLQRVTAVEDRGTAFSPRTIYHVGGSLLVEITHCTHDLRDRHSLMRRWVKSGFVAAPMESTLWVDTYYTCPNGECRRWYNPMERLHESGQRLEINYDWLLADTPANEQALVAECIRRMDCDLRLEPARTA